MVRRATVTDAAEVVRLGAAMFAHMGLPETGAWRQEAERRVADGLSEGSVAAFVVDEPDQPGGFEARPRLVAGACATLATRLPSPLNPTGRTAYVQYVCTEPGHRRQGFARAVLEALIDWCRAGGAGMVELHATPEGEPLYRSLGFAEAVNPALRMALPA